MKTTHHSVNRSLFAPILAAGLAALFVIASLSAAGCAGTPQASAPEAQPAKPSLLPLADGWYSYDFVRVMKGVEAEYLFAAQTGMRMIQETTLDQKGTVILADNGIFRDPAALVLLRADADGRIDSPDNPTISGLVRADGSFRWSGYVDTGMLWHYEVSGRLHPITAADRAGKSFNGLYEITDSASGRKQLVSITDGLYTWRYLDSREEDSLFEPWPTLVQPDGSFTFEMEITSLVEMVGLTRSDFTTRHTMEGRVEQAGGISMQSLTVTGGAGALPSGGAPAVYSGVRSVDESWQTGDRPARPEVLAGAAPATTAATAGATAAAGQQKTGAPVVNSAAPGWFSAIPARDGYLRAAGSKTFRDRSTALAMAEAVAAADLASRLRVHLESSLETAAGTERDSLVRVINARSSLRLPYSVAESSWDAASSTAWVLVEIDRGEALRTAFAE